MTLPTIPRTWQWVSLEHLTGDAPIVYGIIQAGPEYPGGVPYVRPTELVDEKIDVASLKRTSPAIAKQYERSTLKSGDIILAIVGTIGKLAIVPPQLDGANITQSSARIRPHELLSNKYLAAALKSPQLRQQFDEMEFGVAVRRLNIAHVRALQVPCAPINEQQRIVAKLEALQARSRRAREALDEVPALLEKLRQSILAAAFRGDLTKDWRAKNPDVEPAEKLLQRIRAERRKKWEESELARLLAKGKPPTDDRWKAKYQNPPPIDAAMLPPLPAGWGWIGLSSLGELARGKSKHRPRNDPALFGNLMPFIQTGEVARSGGRIRAFSSMYSELGVAQSRVFPAGTLCITIAANIADTGILEFDACFPDSVVGLITDGGPLVARYVELFLRTARADLKRFAPATAQANINLEILSEVAIPIPPEQEMALLAERAETALERANGVTAMRSICLDDLARLERVVLSKAFRGELVPQDPADEPAAAMLARLGAAAAPSTDSSPSPPPGKRRARPRKS